MTDRANSGNGPVRPRFGGLARRREGRGADPSRPGTPEARRGAQGSGPEAAQENSVRGRSGVVAGRRPSPAPRGTPAPEGSGRGAGGGERARPRSGAKEDPSPKLALLFLLCLVTPLSISVGGLNLSPHRLLSLVVVLPLFVHWAGGKFGGRSRADLCLLGFCIWATPAMLYNHGFESIEFIGMLFIETLGPFLIGRAMVRGPEGFRSVVKWLVLILLALAPFMIMEALTGRRIISEAFGNSAFYSAARETRWGMYRAAGSFEHPILAGVFGASCLALFVYALGSSGRTRGRKGMGPAPGVAGSLLLTFFSLSLGAYITAALQFGLIAYDRITRGVKNRWKNLAIGFSAVYLFLLMASNRGPILIFIQTFAFNSFSASIRLQTWNYGTDVIWNNPLFGIGLHDWPRPPWLTGSVDNYWLLHGMRYGYPGVALMIGVFAFTVIPLLKARYDDPDLEGIRKGYLMTVIAMMMAMCTVHLWGAVYAFMMFLLGTGAWLIERDLAASKSAGLSISKEPRGGDGGRR